MTRQYYEPRDKDRHYYYDQWCKEDKDRQYYDQKIKTDNTMTKR